MGVRYINRGVDVYSYSRPVKQQPATATPAVTAAIAAHEAESDPHPNYVDEIESYFMGGE